MNIYISVIFITAVIALVSYWLNTIAYERAKDYSVIIAAILEETLKTLGGVLAGSILYLHISFGVVEGIIELKANKSVSMLSAILAVLGHAAFGYITWTIYSLTGVLFFGILGGIFSHIIYNSLVIGLVNNIKKS
ncbi:hypothetical protein PRVXT_000078 [Proteinivorax tanatarense]|uniref:Uncharacterized protein n=1 Tax=Proteinivorax tanatarense TaxID=1260629 RepID=A0AAU7VLS3_9FIRM